MEKLSVLIVEDEKPNAELLIAHIERHGGMEVIDTARSNADLSKWIEKGLEVDLLFCDIQLLDGTVFSTLDQGLIQSPIIFTTAYDTFYQEAFDSHGIAYLLKPISFDRFSKAIEKFNSLKEKEPSVDWKSILSAIHQGKTNYKERVLVKSGNGMKLIEVKEITCFKTQEGICTAYCQDGSSYEFRHKMSDLAANLDPSKFFQINRGEIVQLAFIELIEPFFNDRLSIKVKKQQQHLLTSASTTAAFRKWLEG